MYYLGKFGLCKLECNKIKTWKRKLRNNVKMLKKNHKVV